MEGLLGSLHMYVLHAEKLATPFSYVVAERREVAAAKEALAPLEAAVQHISRCAPVLLADRGIVVGLRESSC